MASAIWRGAIGFAAVAIPLALGVVWYGGLPARRCWWRSRPCSVPGSSSAWPSAAASGRAVARGSRRAAAARRSLTWRRASPERGIGWPRGLALCLAALWLIVLSDLGAGRAARRPSARSRPRRHACSASLYAGALPAFLLVIRHAAAAGAQLGRRLAGLLPAGGHLGLRHGGDVRRAHLRRPQARADGEPREDPVRARSPGVVGALRRGAGLRALRLPARRRPVGALARCCSIAAVLVGRRAGRRPRRVALQARGGGQGLERAHPGARRRARPARLALLRAPGRGG